MSSNCKKDYLPEQEQEQENNYIEESSFRDEQEEENILFKSIYSQDVNKKQIMNSPNLSNEASKKVQKMR